MNERLGRALVRESLSVRIERRLAPPYVVKGYDIPTTVSRRLIGRIKIFPLHKVIRVQSLTAPK